MSSHHDHHDSHSSEPKKVAFRTPLILALVSVFIIILSVNACDNKKCCKDGEKCETSCDSKHEAEHGDGHSESHDAPAAEGDGHGH